MEYLWHIYTEEEILFLKTNALNTLLDIWIMGIDMAMVYFTSLRISTLQLNFTMNYLITYYSGQLH